MEFTHEEAVNLWSRLVAGWANTLDASGARTLMDGHMNDADNRGSYEGVTRMLWGLGAWLSQPGRPTTVTWRGETYDIVALTRRGIVNGCDPNSIGFWGERTGHPDYRREYDQRTVESGQVGFALWQSREHIWNHLSDSEKSNILTWLGEFGTRPSAWLSNWTLFWVLNHTFRKTIGADYDQSIIDEGTGSYLDGVYVGDGWYDDGPAAGINHFDDYNWWVFSTHEMAWAMMDGINKPERRDELLERIRQRMLYYPYFFAANGAYTEYGRSLSYKFSRLGAPLMAYRMGVWPHSVGMLKRLVGRHLRWYVDHGAVRADGTLRQSLTAGGSVAVMDRYISTGATYWAMLAFAGLWGLPDDDPFWEAEEAPLPAEQGDYTKVIAQPGWVLTAAKGEVKRYNTKSEHHPGYEHKYSKFMYSTRHPFNAGYSQGQPSPDNMLCLTDGLLIGHRNTNLKSSIGDSGWMRMRYHEEIAGKRHTIETAIIPYGAYDLRIHRIIPAGESATLQALEGCSAMGYSPGELPTIDVGQNWLTASLRSRTVGIMGVSGYTQPGLWDGDSSVNSVYHAIMQPIIKVDHITEGHILVALTYDGENTYAFKGITAPQVTWHDDDRIEVIWREETVEIPALSD